MWCGWSPFSINSVWSECFCVSHHLAFFLLMLSLCLLGLTSSFYLIWWVSGVLVVVVWSEAESKPNWTTKHLENGLFRVSLNNQKYAWIIELNIITQKARKCARDAWEGGETETYSQKYKYYTYKQRSQNYCENSNMYFIHLFYIPFCLILHHFPFSILFSISDKIYNRSFETNLKYTIYRLTTLVFTNNELMDK